VDTITLAAPKGRTRRTYTAAFRAQLVAQCRELGVSCSAVAISHGMNPNVLRKWIKDADDGVTSNAKPMTLDVQAAFVPLPMNAVVRHANVANDGGVQIEIQRNGATVSVMWLAASLSESAAWVRAILR
jgi:transposase